jgi:hypothetical protein
MKAKFNLDAVRVVTKDLLKFHAGHRFMFELDAVVF